MYLKLAVLLLFGFVALAVAVPLEDTEEKAEPAESVASDAENPEAPLEESEDDESENDDNPEDAEKELEADVGEDEPENGVEAKKEDDNDKRGYRYKRLCRRYRLGLPVCGRARRSCFKRGPRPRCAYVRNCRYLYEKICMRCRCRSGYSHRLSCKRRRRYCYSGKCRYARRCSCKCRRCRR